MFQSSIWNITVSPFCWRQDRKIPSPLEIGLNGTVNLCYNVLVFTKLKWMIALVVLVLFVVIPASAQTEIPVRIGSLNISEFPQITTYVDVRGPQGFFVSGLPDNAATVFEDEEPLSSVLTEVRPGAQIVVAYAGGENFGIINLEAKTRFAALKDWLLGWSATQLEAGLDTLSLLVPEGVIINHTTEPQAWVEGLQNYQPDFNTATSPIDILSAAIDTALDPVPVEGMGRTVLFLTQGIPDQQQDALQSQIDRADQAGVRLHIGFVSSASLFESNSAVRLQSAALQTEGQYFAYSNDEPLPDLNLIMESSRRAYLLEYRSQISTPGTHTITVMVNTDSGELLSNPVSFEANLAAPIPVFVTPPAQIVRSIPPETDPDLANLAPNTQTLELITEFPDGIPRELSQVSLYINDTLAAQKTEPPFDQISFDLTPYQESAVLEMRLEITDELGLTGTSLTLPTEIIVIQPELGFFSSLGRNVYLIIAGVVGLSGAVLFLVLVLAGRLRPRRLGERRKKRKDAADPVTSPIKEQKKKTDQDQPTVLERITNRLPAAPILQWPSRSRPTTDPYGYLARISEDGASDTEKLYPITASELTFGSDTKQAVIALNDPAVAPLHARLRRDDDGDFFLEDIGSVSGTYHNYIAVSESGSQLNHGDVIHIGTIGYRFTLSKPAKIRQPVVTPLDESSDPFAKDGKG